VGYGARFSVAIMGSLNPPPQSSIETMSLDCLVFEKTAFCVRVSGDIQTDR